MRLIFIHRLAIIFEFAFFYIVNLYYSFFSEPAQGQVDLSNKHGRRYWESAFAAAFVTPVLRVSDGRDCPLTLSASIEVAVYECLSKVSYIEVFLNALPHYF